MERVSLLASPSEAAEFIVALTSADDKKALAAAALARSALSEIAAEYEGKIGELWDAANKEALSHLLLVMGNNPHKPVEAIVARKDVQSALLWPYEQAAQQSEELMNAAWDTAEKESVKMAKGEAKLLGAVWKGYETDRSLLDNLVGDLHANAKAMRSRVLEALKSDKEQGKALGQVTNDATRRAKYSISVSVWSVAAQVRDSAARMMGLNRIWVSRMDSKTCNHCKALHGWVVGPGEPFPKGHLLKTYRDTPLFGPPRHPNCRCVVVLTFKKRTLEILKAKT